MRAVFADAESQATIISAMRRFEQLVAANNRQCILFRPRRPSDQYYILIISYAGCWSYVSVLRFHKNPDLAHTSLSIQVGQVSFFTAGQTVSLQMGGCIEEGLIMHELTHALGTSVIAFIARLFCITIVGLKDRHNYLM